MGDTQDGRGMGIDVRNAARAHPQNAYSALQRSVQQEWQYLQRTTTNIESFFHVLE